MSIIEKARDFGKELQNDESYLKVSKTLEKVNADKVLSAKMDEFYELRGDLEKAVLNAETQEERDNIITLDEKIQTLLKEINENPLMIDYNNAKREMEITVSQINKIISLSANGENPEEINLESCSGNCSSCGGC